MICFAHLSPMYTCVDSFNLLQHINTLIFFTWPYDISIFNRYMLYKWWLIPPAMWDAKRFEPRELTFYLWRLGSRSWASCLIATTLDATIDTDVVSISVYNPPLTYMYVYIYICLYTCVFSDVNSTMHKWRLFHPQMRLFHPQMRSSWMCPYHIWFKSVVW